MACALPAYLSWLEYLDSALLPFVPYRALDESEVLKFVATAGLRVAISQYREEPLQFCHALGSLGDKVLETVPLICCVLTAL